MKNEKSGKLISKIQQHLNEHIAAYETRKNNPYGNFRKAEEAFDAGLAKGKAVLTEQMASKLSKSRVGTVKWVPGAMLTTASVDYGTFTAGVYGAGLATLSSEMASAYPHRIQRKRTKGWKLPPRTVCVDRSSRWGNPYVVDDDMTVDEAIRLFQVYIEKLQPPSFMEDIRRELRGRDLACYCPLDQPCHADVLLKLANS